jgi:hypothetical protein
MRFVFLVQVVLGDVSKPISQKILNRLLASIGNESLVAAIEADQSLTSRYREDGAGDFELAHSQMPAAQSVSFTGWRGQTLWTAPTGVVHVSGNWAFEVLA